MLDLSSPGNRAVYLFPVSHSFTVTYFLVTSFLKKKKPQQPELVNGEGFRGVEARSKQSQSADMVTFSVHAERTLTLETCDPAEFSRD